jgi:hypothetical protein
LSGQNSGFCLQTAREEPYLTLAFLLLSEREDCLLFITTVPNTYKAVRVDRGEEDSERVREKNARGRDILLPGGLLKMLL